MWVDIEKKLFGDWMVIFFLVGICGGFELTWLDFGGHGRTLVNMARSALQMFSL